MFGVACRFLGSVFVDTKMERTFASLVKKIIPMVIIILACSLALRADRLYYLSTMRGEEGERVPRIGRPGALLFCAALVLGACQDSSEQPVTSTTTGPSPVETSLPPPETVTTLPTAASTVPAERCTFLRAVTPGEYFNSDNAAKIEAQLDLLRDLHAESADIGLREIGLAGGAVRASFRDPLFAEAIVLANEATQDGQELDVAEFLQLPVSEPERCDDEHLSKEDARTQLEQTVDIGGVFTGKIGAQLGRDVGDLTRRAFDRIQEEYDEFKQKLEQGDY